MEKTQEEIVKEIRNRTSSIENAINKLKKQLLLLSELRNREMLDAVLGTIDLRDVVIPEFKMELDDEIEGFVDDEDDVEEV